MQLLGGCTKGCVIMLHRAVFEQLVLHWDTLTARAMGLLPGATNQASQSTNTLSRGSTQGRKKAKRLQLNDQGLPDWDSTLVRWPRYDWTSHLPSDKHSHVDSVACWLAVFADSH